MSNLPYDVEIEYIESSGTQYINTGITPTATTKVVFKFINLQASGQAIIGYQESTDKNDWRFFNYNQKAYFDTYGGTGTSGTRIYGGNIYVGNPYTLEMGNYYIKNLETGTNIISGTAYTGTGYDYIYINGSQTPSKNRWYFIQIYDNDTLLRDYIPVRVGNVGYLYDKVSGTLFGNSGTGDFILGEDKALPNLFGFRRRLMINERASNEYITDSIVAWWDGIWNAGVDSPHNNAATSWADLSGNNRNMTLSQASWDDDSFVVLQSTQNTSTIPSVFSFITCEIVAKIDWAVNTNYKEVCVLSGLIGLGFYKFGPVNGDNGNFYFTDNSGGGFSNKRFFAVLDGYIPAILSSKFSCQYIVGGNTQASLSDWKAIVNGTERTMNYGAAGIGSSGTGINKRSDRRFAGNVYALRMYDRALSDSELMHNLKIDNRRFNLGLTL